jgi:hypothetical protein
VASKPVPASSALYLGRALLLLRAFLGFTFCFAGLQKLANPRFFDAADPASIQSQLASATGTRVTLKSERRPSAMLPAMMCVLPYIDS